MGESVEVEISINAKDIKRALSYEYFHISRMWICFVIFAVALCAQVLYGVVNGFSSHLGGQIAVVSVCGLLLHLFYYQIPVEKHIEFYRKRGSTVFTFNQQNIKTFRKEVQSVFEWSVFQKAFETPTAFIMVDKNNSACILPKRCFENALSIELLQQLIRANVKVFKQYGR